MAARCTIWHLSCNALFVLGKIMAPNFSDKDTTIKPLKLLDQVRQFAGKTQYSYRQTYVDWIKRYFLSRQASSKDMKRAM
jgi:hypothetical protein